MSALQEAGFMAYPTIGLGLLGVLLGLVGLATATTGSTRVVAIVVPAVAIVFAFLACASGAAGYFLGLRAAEGACMNADPASRDLLMAVGRAEAAQNFVVAGVAATPAFVLGGLGIAIGALRKLPAPRD